MRVPCTVSLACALLVLFLLAALSDAGDATPEAPLDKGAMWHGQAERIARCLESTPQWRVRADATFLRVRAACARGLLGGHSPLSRGSAHVIPSSLAQRLLRLCCGGGVVRPEPLPPLFLCDGQAGRFGCLTEQAYLQDYEEETGVNSGIKSPILGAMAEGVRLDLVVRRQSTFLVLEIDAVWAAIDRPVPAIETVLVGSRTAVTVELPETRVARARSRVDVPSQGGYILLGCGAARDDGDLHLAVLRLQPPSD